MTAILPGSYDPITKGHLGIIKKASEQYERVYVVAFINPDKRYRFSVEERLEMLNISTRELPNVYTDFYGGLVIDYMNEKGIDVIVKGYRNGADLEYERQQAAWNLRHGGYETVLVKCEDELTSVSSTAARRAIDVGEDLSEFLTPEIVDFVKKH